MKKKALSLLLALMMLISLVPVGALAADITVVVDPASLKVKPGETATFTASGGSFRYYWFLVDPDNNVVIPGDNEKSTLSLTNCQFEDDGTSVYCISTSSNLGSVIAGLLKASSDIKRTISTIESLGGAVTTVDVSEPAVLHVTAPECASHSLGTNLSFVEGTAPSCAEEGNYPYYYCNICNSYYLEPDGTRPIDREGVVIPKLTTHGEIVHYDAKPGTCCETGYTEHYACSVCGQAFTDEFGTSKLAKSEYETDKVASNHTDLVHHDAVAATCSKQGNIEYWYCSGCNSYFTDAAGTKEISKLKLDVDRDKYNHLSLVEYSAKAPTCKEEGNIHYWYCEDCHDYFTDPQGHNEVNHADTELPRKDHHYAWFAMSEGGVEWHENRCTECGNIKETGQHSGGTATCTSPALCETCGAAYGEIDPDNHPNLVREIVVPATKTQPGICDVYCPDCGYEEMNVSYNLKDLCKHKIERIDLVSAKCEDCEDGYGMRAHYECTICGTIFKDKEGKTEITDIDSLKIDPLPHYVDLFGDQQANTLLYGLSYGHDNVGHWEICRYCGFDFGKIVGYGVHNMRNSTADCVHGTKTCIICGYTTEDKAPDKHTGATEVQGAYEPEGDQPGYTGDTVCTSCGEIIEKGHIYYAVCGECAKHLNYFAGKDPTCTEYGNAEYWQCTKCLHYYADAKATVELETTVLDPLGHDFHPGLDAFTSVDVIDIIQNMFPDMDWGQIIKEFFDGDFSAVTDIELDDFIESVHMRDMDHCSDDTYHWLGCQRCGLNIRDLKPYFEENGIVIDDAWYTIGDKAEHSGGLADCQSRAICDECGDAYGELGDHRFNTRTIGNSCTEPTKVEHYCTVCGFVDESLTEDGPAKGHVFDGGKCSVCGQILQNPFYDVKSGDRYFTPVMWAYYFQPQIIAGATATTFNPQGSCTRAQVVTFLWRHAGRPDPTITVSPFYDVQNPNAYYYKAVLWAYENNVVAGITETSFQPDTTVNRAQFVTFLWRYMGRPEPVNNFNPFMDVSDTSPYRTAIVWAVGAGVTSGYDASHFQPTRTCSRWQVATFMYNAIHGK